MGANIRIEGRTSVVEGVPQLTGTKVNATDLRGGAALVLAGLAAGGITEVSNVEFIKRGYDNFHRQALKTLELTSRKNNMFFAFFLSILT